MGYSPNLLITFKVRHPHQGHRAIVRTRFSGSFRSPKGGGRSHLKGQISPKGSSHGKKVSSPGPHWSKFFGQWGPQPPLSAGASGVVQSLWGEMIP